MRRNIEMHTGASEAKRNVLAFLAANCTSPASLARKSTLGYVAFPGYDFKKPQGAAFAVSKIVRQMEDDGLIRYECHESPTYRRGHYITAKGLAALAA